MEIEGDRREAAWESRWISYKSGWDVALIFTGRQVMGQRKEDLHSQYHFRKYRSGCNSLRFAQRMVDDASSTILRSDDGMHSTK